VGSASTGALVSNDAWITLAALSSRFKSPNPANIGGRAGVGDSMAGGSGGRSSSAIASTGRLAAAVGAPTSPDLACFARDGDVVEQPTPQISTVTSKPASPARNRRR